MGFTITTLDDRISRLMEPGASVATERLAAMKELSEKDIPIWAFVGPIIQGVLTEDNIGEMVREIKATGCPRILIDPLRLKPGLGEAMREPLQRISEITGRACGMKSSDGFWYQKLKEKTCQLCSEAGIACEQGL